MSFHIICERDVGLFSLIQQVIANVPWALRESRIPIVYFRERNCYWTPKGYHGQNCVWEYYFEPLLAAYPAATVPEHIRKTIDANFPNSLEVGYLADSDVYVSNHFGDHPDLNGKALSIPYLLDDPDDELRLEANKIIREYIHPRAYIQRKVDDFFACHMATGYIIGIHARGTDAISKEETRPHRQGSLVLSKYSAEVQRLLNIHPEAKIFVATDDQASLDYFKERFGSRVIAYDSLRHEGGDVAGEGPTGEIMPAYIAGDRDRAARNGEEAVIEYLLLSRCSHLIHNAGSLARTALLNAPDLPHTNTHRPQTS
ncbi:MAG TPA: hypothetical protein VE078_17165 [Thermoanaerobaculia bacterium]|nr:hypothetical protein [Thermoanaerobaculia bacterium]